MDEAERVRMSAKTHVAVWDASRIPEHVGGTTPLLQFLHLECDTHYRRGHLGPEHPPLVISDSLVHRPYPLRKLVVKAVLSRYNMLEGLAKNLMSLHLTIFTTTSGRPPRPSVDETLQIIQAAPRLEALCIERKWSSALDPIDAVCDIPPRSSRSTPYPLPRLRSLHLLGGMDCIILLDYLAFPVSTRVEVARTAETIPPALMRSIHIALSRLFLSSPIVSLVLGYGEGAYDLAYCDELGPTDITRISRYERRIPRLKITPSREIFDIVLNVPQEMECLYMGLPLSRLRALHLQYEGEWTDDHREIIKRYFGSLPELHTISISEKQMALDMIPMLGQTAAGNQVVEGSGSTMMLFPAVRTLCLDFWDEKWTTYAPYVPPAPRPADVTHNLLEQLLHVLSLRRRRGCGIEKLVLIACDVSQNGVDRVKEIVPNVEIHSYEDVYEE
ncbi:hypothetical protein PM082_013790 [Marasmius tenuissimus]|nr:hypothetical protein PM082_013790 [Marasmius tenuissimus]